MFTFRRNKSNQGVVINNFKLTKGRPLLSLRETQYE